MGLFSGIGNLVGGLLPLAGKIIGGMIGGPFGAMIGNMIGSLIGNGLSGQAGDIFGDSGLGPIAQQLLNSNYASGFNLGFGL